MFNILLLLAKVFLPLVVVLGASFFVWQKTQVNEIVPRPETQQNILDLNTASSPPQTSNKSILENTSLGTTSPMVKKDLPEKAESPLKKVVSNILSSNSVPENIVEKILTASNASSTPVAPFDFNSVWRDSIVNLLCANRYGDITSVSSGTGILIDSRGIILTNAHVGIEFLFADWPSPSLYDCSVRTGSPAAPLYRAALLYIPDEFVTGEIANLYSPDDGRVYGKNDYALLVITGRTDQSISLPGSFPHLSLNVGPALAINTPVFLIGYPASFLGGISIQRDLFLLSSPATVNVVRPIGDGNQDDVIAFGGNVIGQHGSSGGGVIGPGGTLAGLMTFFDKGYGYTTNERILNAITLGYIDRDLEQDTGASLSEFLSQGDFISRSKFFMNNQGARYQRAYANVWREKQGIVIPGFVY